MIPDHALRARMIDPTCLLPGDIALIRMKEPGVVQRRIEEEQKHFFPAVNARWTHAGVTKDNYQVVEMTLKGAKTTPLWDYPLDKWDLCFRRVKTLTMKGRHTIVDAAYENSRLRASYDFWGIFKLKRVHDPQELNSLSRPTIKSSICSALCARSLAPLGIDVGEGTDHRLVTPAQLSFSTLLVDVPISYVTAGDFIAWWKARFNTFFNP